MEDSKIPQDRDYNQRAVSIITVIGIIGKLFSARMNEVIRHHTHFFLRTNPGDHRVLVHGKHYIEAVIATDASCRVQHPVTKEMREIQMPTSIDVITDKGHIGKIEATYDGHIRVIGNGAKSEPEEVLWDDKRAKELIEKFLNPFIDELERSA